jgi:hypothetical protein
MSEETTDAQSESLTKTLNTSVAARIAACAPDVTKRLEDLLVEKEVSRRTEIIGQGLAKLDQSTRERYKLAKPSTTSYNLDGTIAGTAYTKEAVEALKKHDETHAKLERAVEKALKGDLKDLCGLVGSK